MHIFVYLSLLAGLIVSFCWILGDVWIVGYDKNRIPDQKYHDKMRNPDYSLYLESSEKRLRKGALVANYSTPLMFASLYSIWYLLGANNYAWITIIVLAIGFVYAPLAHVSFYYVGMIYRYRYHIYKKGYDMNENGLKETEKSFMRLVYFAWWPSIILTGIGWLMFAAYVGLEHSTLPRIFALVNPFFLSFLFMILPKIPYPGKPRLNGACFNLAGFVFYLTLLLYLL